ncbi:hypothetical protein ONE63_004160 [Megalurothrips usitatus]|uniref:Secreted protein n=1 Tax=Megalurothrips usitatus TaxID=439358 RepID=A0AAV7X6A5_9NEOP|nr:hypothetical protein ONE63_004160 [Megalurothrips usitatus]
MLLWVLLVLHLLQPLLLGVGQVVHGDEAVEVAGAARRRAVAGGGGPLAGRRVLPLDNDGAGPRGRRHGLGLDAAPAGTVRGRHLRAGLLHLVGRARGPGDGGRRRVHAVRGAVHVVEGVVLHLAHVVPRVSVVLLVAVGRHHVPVGHVPVGQARVHVPAGLLAAAARPAGVLAARQQRPAAQRVLVLLQEGLRLAPRPVLVVGVLLHVHGPQPLRLVDEGPLILLREQLPLGAQPLGDLRVVHLGVVLRHLAPLPPRPDHEGVHGPLDAVHVLVGLGGVVVVVGVELRLRRRLMVVLRLRVAAEAVRLAVRLVLVLLALLQLVAAQRALVAVAQRAVVAQRALQRALVAQRAVVAVAQRAVRRLHVVLVGLVGLVGRLVPHLRHGVLVLVLRQRRRQRRRLVLLLRLHVHVAQVGVVAAVHVQAVVRRHRRVQAASLEVRLHRQHIVLSRCEQLGS